MTCKKCGSMITKNLLFCPECGAPIEKEAANMRALKSKKFKKKIILWGIVALIVCSAIIALVHMLPLEVDYKISKKKLTTTESELSDLTFNVNSNQPILSVSYSYQDGENEELVTKEASLSFGIWNREASIKSIPVLPGNNTIKLTIKTLLGSEEEKITVKREIGFTTEPDKSAFVKIEEGSYLVSNELILVFKDEVSDKEINKLIDKYEGTIVGRLYEIGEYHVRFMGRGENFIKDLKKNIAEEDIVEKVYLNYSHDFACDYYSNDQKFDSWDSSNPSGNNWWLETIDAPEAWEYRDKLKTVKIGVIDSCLEYDHEDLKINPNRISVLPTSSFKNMREILDYYKSTQDTHKCQGKKEDCRYCEMKSHGTHCSGIIAAGHDNKIGISGVAPNAELYFATWWYLNAEPNGQLSVSSSTDSLLYNINYMVSSGCRVISISVGAYSPETLEGEAEEAQRINDAIEKLENMGYDFLLFKAAGNDRDDASSDVLTRLFKKGASSSAHLVVVGACKNSSYLWESIYTTLGGMKKIYSIADFSNTGNYINVVAPGVKVYSTVPRNTYENMQGTSMATPLAAGVACLMYGANPNLTYDYVKSILKYTHKNFCTDKKSNYYHVVNAKNCVEWALNNGKSLPSIKEPSIGFVTGMVQDAKTLNPIENTAVTAISVENGTVFNADLMEGVYSLVLEPGHYDLEFHADGYIDEKMYNIEITKGNVSYNVLLNLIEDNPGTGVAEGRIVNAFDASSVTNAQINVYRGINKRDGNPVAVTSSDSNGKYLLDLAPGNYTLFVEAEGYIGSSTNILVLSGERKSNQDCSMTPILKEGEMRVVLIWGQFPADLDSHLNGPMDNGNSFHIYFENMKHNYNSKTYAMLDVDDTTSYGPETTSVYIASEGTYTFRVHDYTNRNLSYSKAMSLSGAQVKLYIAGKSDAIVYNVPTKEGTIWTVFSVTNGVVKNINAMGYVSDPRTIGK